MAKSISEAADNKKTRVAQVERFGEKILIPTGMTLDDAIRNLQAKKEEEEQVVSLFEKFDVFFLEGVYAMVKVLDDRYGWFQQISTPGFFGSNPPAMVGVDIDIDEHGVVKTVQVPWGRFLVPNIPEKDGWMQTAYEVNENGFIVFKLAAQLKKKHSVQFHELCAAIRQELQTTSLYKGKAITIAFRSAEGEKIEMPMPQFQRLNHVSTDSIVFSRHVEQTIEANLYTPITKSQLCRENGIPLKRGILLAGPYGTGKTLVAAATAALARKHGWTYVYCKSAADFPDVVRFAQCYQPAVVFCEDIDKVAKGERSAEIDLVLNTIDGVDSKNTELILVLTTNEVEKINKAMIRPGRLDAVISVERPDAEAVQRLIRLYAGEKLAADADLHAVGQVLAGNTPAVIREVVERSKLYAISLGENGKLTGDALTVSARTMQNHLKLLNEENKAPLTAVETFSNVVGAHLAQGLVKAVQSGMKTVPEAPEMMQHTGIPTVSAQSLLEQAGTNLQQ